MNPAEHADLTGIEQRLADLDDLLDLRTARKKSADEPTLSLEEVKKELGLQAAVSPGTLPPSHSPSAPPPRSGSRVAD